MEYKKTHGVNNPAYREQWVVEKLKLLKGPKNTTLLDVGAGSSPYRKICESLEYKYYSHDFNAYHPNETPDSYIGLHNPEWKYSSHDFICEILSIPETTTYDLVLCTETFEHIPDPVRALEKLTKLVKPGGIIIITAPFISLMHQAPYWFQSGLSPYWFNYWSEKNNLEVLNLEVFGDYIDLMQQEGVRFIYSTLKFRGSGKLGKKIMSVLSIYRKRMNKNLLYAGGFGTLYVGKRK